MKRRPSATARRRVLPDLHRDQCLGIADYANADPSALWQAADATAAFVAVTGS